MIIKRVPGFPDYFAARNGDIWSCKRSKKPVKLNPAIDNGYYKITAIVEGKRINVNTHRLVALAFFGMPKSTNMHVAHYDGNGLNNKIENLRWATPSENSKDRIRHGTNRGPVGEQQKHKITENDVKEIRKLYSLGEHTQLELAEMFGVCRPLISMVINRKRWLYVS